MAKVIFEELTERQAIELAHWYCGQGEQDADVWFDINGIKTPMVAGINVDHEKQVVTVTCK